MKVFPQLRTDLTASGLHKHEVALKQGSVWNIFNEKNWFPAWKTPRIPGHAFQSFLQEAPGLQTQVRD